ncbi:MAG: uroporphyrinogen decarboxylase family protein [bacterium]|nr:uroporphyrinogen decarboxylase family protein [bacterium]
MSESREADYSVFQEGVALMADAMRGTARWVPVYAQMHEFVAEQCGIPRREFFRRPELLVSATLDTQARFGLDVPAITYDVYNIEAEALGQGIQWSEDGMPDIDRTAPLIRDRADLSRIRTPDFDSQPACQRVLEMYAHFRRLAGIEPGLSFCAPFTLATNLRGIEQFLLDMYTDPEFARDLLARISEEVLAPWIVYLQRHFPHSTKISGVDATASPPIVNLTLLREWVVPSILRLRELSGPGVAVANWAGERYLKRPEEMLDLKLLVGPGPLLGQDPDVEALGPGFYKTYADLHDVPLILGVGAGFLAQERPAAVAERVRRYAEVGARGGRFALYLCNLGANTPPENLRAAVEAAHAVAVA